MLDIIETLTIPANTRAIEPVELDIALAEGIVKRVIISFKRGCRYMVKTSLHFGGEQKLPFITGQGYSYDSYNLLLYPDWDITKKHHIITVKGWSDETIYPHTLQYLFTIDDSGDSGADSLLRSLVG